VRAVRRNLLGSDFSPESKTFFRGCGEALQVMKTQNLQALQMWRMTLYQWISWDVNMKFLFKAIYFWSAWFATGTKTTTILLYRLTAVLLRVAKTALL
jgi:hypothetical protein